MSTTAQDRKLFSLRIAQRLLESSRKTGGSGVYLACTEVEDLVEMASREMRIAQDRPVMPRPGFHLLERLRVLLGFGVLPEASRTMVAQDERGSGGFPQSSRSF